MNLASADDVQVGTFVPFTGLRGAVARSMTAAWQAPSVAIGIDVDVGRLLELRAERQKQASGSPRLSPTHFVMRALALALREHPDLNGMVESDGVRLHERIDIGLAVNVPTGVLVPVVRDVDRKHVAILAEETSLLAELARAGKIPPSSMRGATFTFSTLGATGIDWFIPIINSPQIAILGTGAIVKRVVADGERAVIAPMMTLTLVFDHRATDGYPAARFLATLRAQIEHPAEL